MTKRTERVQVPVGLIEDLMDWCNDELERAAALADLAEADAPIVERE